MPHRHPATPLFLRLAATALMMPVLLAPVARAQSEATGVYAKDSPAVKQTQIDQLFEGARERAEKNLSNARRAAKIRARRAKGDRVEHLAFDEDIAAGRKPIPRSELPASIQNLLASPTNVTANDKTPDAAGAGQAEESIAMQGNYGLAAWNDGQGFNTSGDVQNCAYTTDGGATWFRTPAVGVAPAGSPPHYGGSPLRTWTSDPVVTVNEKTGEFYYCGLNITLGGHNGIGVVRATFPAGVFTWDTPRIVVDYVASGSADKQWIAADSTNGNLYVSWTRFTPSDSILFSRSTDNGVTWSPAITVSSPAAAGLVQGSRPVVGPSGEVYVTWSELGPIDADFFRIRKSTNAGVSFGAEQTVSSLFENFGTGAPGFNRERGITFPAIAVDRSFGPNRGRVYVTWNETINWYDDALGTGGSKSEVNNTTNNFFGGSETFVAGQVLRGSLSTTSDLDYWKFSATQGTTYIFWTDSIPRPLYTMRMFCTDTTGGGTRLAYSGDITAPSGGNGFIVWTAPTTASYYLRLAYVTGGTGTGGYHILTGVDAPSGGDRARDQRDAMLTYSDDGTTWVPSVRVNDDPAYYDNYLPEVAVGCDGYPYVFWYDWRDAVSTCGGSSHIYITRSMNGGATWVANQKVTTAITPWTTTASNIAPNQGDYQGFYGGSLLALAWADGRLGDADVFTARVDLDFTAGCPPSSTVLANDPYNASFSITNNNIMFGQTLNYSVTVNRNWPGLPINGSSVLAAGGTNNVPFSFTIPDTAATEDVQLCITVAQQNGARSVRCCVTLQVLNPATAALASLVSASADNGVVRLAWQLADAAAVNVYRSTDGRGWDLLSTVSPDGENRILFEDATVARGTRYAYRLGVRQPGGEVPAGETWIDVPEGASFALHGARPNPSVGRLSVSFSLASATKATLEMIDLNGRRVYEQSVGGRTGFQVVTLDQVTHNLPMGIYALRLTQDGRTLTSKVTIVR